MIKKKHNNIEIKMGTDGTVETRLRTKFRTTEPTVKYTEGTW